MCVEHKICIFYNFWNFSSSWKSYSIYCTSITRLPHQTSSTNFSQTHSPGQSNPGETKTTTPKLSSSFSGSDSIVVEEAARNFRSPRPSTNKSLTPNFFIQHDKIGITGLETWRPVQPWRVNNLSALLIERGQFSAVYFYFIWQKIWESRRWLHLITIANAQPNSSTK